MKLTIKSLAILVMATVGITGCSDDESNVNEKPKEYALAVKFSLTPNDTTLRGQLIQTVEAAMSNAGISKDASYLYITARDSADAAPRVKEIGSKLEAVLDRNADKMHGDAYIMAIEKKQLEASDSKQRKWACWYAAAYPASDNGTIFCDWHKKVYYGYELEIINREHISWSSPSDESFSIANPKAECYKFVCAYDMNVASGGNYLYLKVGGVTDPNHPDYKDRLITDVVMLNTGNDSHYPEYVDITKGGKSRRYYPVFAEDKGANGSTKHDLNDGAGGPYLWMYYTTDYRDGWVLASYGMVDGNKWGTQIVIREDVKDEKPGQYGLYMHAYKKQSGKWVDCGLANLNSGIEKSWWQYFFVDESEIYFKMGFCKILRQ